MSTRYSMVVTAGTDMNRQALLKYGDRSKFLRSLSNVLDGLSAGNERAGQCDLQLDDGTNGTAGTPPSQTVTYSGSSGAQTIVIGGRTINFTAGASDTATALAAIAAIVADAIAGPGCAASNVAGVLTVKLKVHALFYGICNGVTFTATGTGSSAGGATMTGGVSAIANGFSL